LYQFRFPNYRSRPRPGKEERFSRWQLMYGIMKGMIIQTSNRWNGKKPNSGTKKVESKLDQLQSQPAEPPD
jgi:hypothetical protein